VYKIETTTYICLSVPSGRPQITSAQNLSSTSLRVTWRPPHPSTVHGEFLGYRVVYRQHHENNRRTEEDVREVVLDEAEANNIVIKGLNPFTRYFVSVQVVNPEGAGPSATCVVGTDEGGELDQYKNGLKN
jgi:hypothetical protein